MLTHIVAGVQASSHQARKASMGASNIEEICALEKRACSCIGTSKSYHHFQDEMFQHLIQLS